MLVRYVEAWIERLAAGDWKGAISLIETPNRYGVRWSTADVRRALVEYGRGAEPTVTLPKLHGQVAPMEVYAFDDGSGYAVDCGLFLDGTLSDLTAQFEFLLSGNEFFATLHDIHVL